MEIIKSRKEYDAVIVGSGAGGGMSAKILAEQGLNVAIIEAGPYFDPALDEYRTTTSVLGIPSPWLWIYSSFW